MTWDCERCGSDVGFRLGGHCLWCNAREHWADRSFRILGYDIFIRKTEVEDGN